MARLPVNYKPKVEVAIGKLVKSHYLEKVKFSDYEALFEKIKIVISHLRWFPKD